jgi:hypothetical protein
MMAMWAKRVHGVQIDTLDWSGCRDKNGGSRKVNTMAKTWETPSFVEINMSAEIGGYQSDFGDRDPMEPVAAPADASEAA